MEGSHRGTIPRRRKGHHQYPPNLIDPDPDDPNPTITDRRRRAESDMQKATARIPMVESSDFWRQAEDDGVAIYAHGACWCFDFAMVARRRRERMGRFFWN